MTSIFGSMTYSQMLDGLGRWKASTASFMARDEDERPLGGYLAMEGEDTPDNVAAIAAALGIETEPLPQAGGTDDGLADIDALRAAGVRAKLLVQAVDGRATRAVAVMVTPEAAEAVEEVLEALDAAEWS